MLRLDGFFRHVPDQEIAGWNLECSADTIERIEVDSCRPASSQRMRRVVGNACTLG
jgi:hypothetical protein